MVVQGHNVMMAEINFLCSHKKLREKRIAPVLIKEITRRVNVMDIWQAVYTAGKTLPTPFATAQYWHRNLNPKKLIEVGFSYLPANKTMTQIVKMAKIKQDHFVAGFREMQQQDLTQVTTLLNNHLNEYKVHIAFSEQEVAHFLLPQ
jgi:glycylpeptide N-tetradecanoyltransferase